jgi:hypothetical protein
VALALCVAVTIGAGVAPQLIVGPATHGTPYLVEPPAPTPPPHGTGASTPSSTPPSTTLPGLGTSGQTVPGAAPGTGN